jgi:hypothetical protein
VGIEPTVRILQFLTLLAADDQPPLTRQPLSLQPGVLIMYTTADYFIHQSITPVARNGLALYNAALVRGCLKRIGAALLGRNRTLRHLPEGSTTAKR